MRLRQMISPLVLGLTMSEPHELLAVAVDKLQLEP